jgi:hypothetical protein
VQNPQSTVVTGSFLTTSSTHQLIFVEQSAAAARNNNQLGHLKRNLEFPAPTNIGVKL